MGEMRGMCDEGERITKGVGGIRVSCYGPVTLLEHGRMRLRAQHVNKGGGHICKTARWPHGASGHLGSHLAPRPLGELWCPPRASWHLRNGSLPVEAQLFPLPDLLPAFWPPSPLFFQLWQPHGCFRRSHDGHMRVSRHFLNIRPCASNRDEYAGSNHEIDGFNVRVPFLIRIFQPGPSYEFQL